MLLLAVNVCIRDRVQRHKLYTYRDDLRQLSLPRQASETRQPLLWPGSEQMLVSLDQQNRDDIVNSQGKYLQR